MSKSRPSASEEDQANSPARTIDNVDAAEVQAAPQMSLPRAVIIILTCTMAMVVNVSNVTMVSIALPIIGRDLTIPSSRLQWLVSAYSLSSGCFLVFFGRIADLYGRKRVFIAGSAWLTVSSIWLTLVKDEISLDVLRGFQGIGAAATIPSSVGILAQAFPPSRLRSFAFATFSAGAPIGAAVGTLVGGVLTQLTSQTWRSVFYFAAGLSAAVLVLGLFSIDADQSSEVTDRRVDWIGAFLITAGLVLIVFVLSDGEIVGWTSPYIITLLILGVLCVVGFVLWERHLEEFHSAHPQEALISKWTPPPLMKPSIWSRARGRFAVAMAIAFLNWSAFLSWLFWVQLYYQDYLGLTPILSMVRLLPMWVTGVLCNLAVALFIGRLGLVWIVAIGTLLTGTASLLFALINPAAPYWAYGFPAAIASVFGAEFVFASGLIFVAKVSENGEQGLAGGLFNVMTQIGTAFGLTISTIVFNRVSACDTGASAEEVRAATLLGYKAAQWTAFGFAMLAAVLAAMFLRGVGIVGHSKQSIAQDEKRALKEELKKDQVTK